jgi:hypothetical protein
LSAQNLGFIFDIQACRVRKTHGKAKARTRPPRQPTALKPDEENVVIRFIEAGSGNGSFVIQMDMFIFVEKEFGKCRTAGRIQNFFVRHADRICRAVIAPQEKPRLEIPQLFLDKYLVLIKKYIPLVPTESIFNIDECGFNDSEERKSRLVVIPTGIRNSTFHYPVNRGIRHRTFICCISPAGDAYCPLLIASDPAVRQAVDQRVREALDLRIEIATSPDANVENFDRYCDRVPISAVVSNCEIDGCQNNLAILRCDNCAARCLDDVLRKLASHGIFILTYMLHTSHLFQVLDVLLFAVLRRAKMWERRDDTLPVVVHHVLRLFWTYEKASPSTTTTASWSKTGYDYERRKGATYLTINKSKI